MERDFLGIGGKDLAAAEEAGFLGSSAVHWPFSNKIPAVQQFMNCKASQEERARKVMLDHLSTPGFQPVPTVGVFDANHRSPSVLVSQKHLVFDRQGIHQFQLPSYPVLGSDPFNISASHHSNEIRTFPAVPHHSLPVATSCPFFNKVSGSANGSNLGATSFMQQQPYVGGRSAVLPTGDGSIAAAFAQRNTAKPSGTTAQLTIFYGGTVNVYDDVPLEKAQAIMFLAANGLNSRPNVVNLRAQRPVAVPAKAAENEAINTSQTQNKNQAETHRNAAQPCALLSSPMSTASHSAVQPGSGYSSTDDPAGAKAAGSLVPTSQQEPPKAFVTAVESPAGANLVPRAIPQARKASLARFLEKRKERVSMAAPYPSAQKSRESTSEFDGKSATAETAHSSSKEPSWRLDAHKKSSDSSYSPPSTKLEI